MTSKKMNLEIAIMTLHSPRCLKAMLCVLYTVPHSTLHVSCPLSSCHSANQISAQLSCSMSPVLLCCTAMYCTAQLSCSMSPDVTCAPHTWCRLVPHTHTHNQSRGPPQTYCTYSLTVMPCPPAPLSLSLSPQQPDTLMHSPLANALGTGTAAKTHKPNCCRQYHY